MNIKQLQKPYMHQFYRGNRWRFALAMTSALITTAAALAASWLLQVILDLANGTDVGFTFSQVLLLALVGAGAAWQLLGAFVAGCVLLAGVIIAIWGD